MLVRRMSQRNRAEQERMAKEALREVQAAEGGGGAPASPMTASMKLEEELAKKDTAMLDLQRRVEGESSTVDYVR